MSQNLPLREQLEKLEQLQEVDLKILNLKNQLESLPSELQTMDQKIQALQESAGERKAALESAQKGEAQIRASIQMNDDRLKKAEQKLEEASNPQEYGAANKEVEQLKKLSEELQVESVQVSEKVKSAENELNEIQGELDTIQSERESKASELSEQEEKVQEELSALNQHREEKSSGIGRALLSRYERVRDARGGVGVAPAAEGRCKGCNMMIPPQMFNQIQKADNPISCPTCQRLLFVPQSSEKD